MKRKLAVVVLIAFTTLATLAFAQASAKPAVKAEIQNFKVVTENGTEKFVAATAAKPGDVIEYRAEYTNNGKSAVTNVKGVVPIPSGMEYVADSAQPKTAEASTDGVQYGAIPLKRVVTKNGVKVEEVVPASAYKFIRWNLGNLAPGAKAEVKARARLTPVKK